MNIRLGAVDDREIVARQLGRSPRAFRRVAVRCPFGRPAITEQQPYDDDGEPFPTTYYLTCPHLVAAVSRLEATSVTDAARRYAPTLIPIAAVYFVSHYFLYLIYASQFTWAAVADPFGREWVPDATPWTGVPGSLVWYIQVALIVWGHVVAVFEAHRVSLGVHVDARRAVMAQVPLILLMVGYTFTGLWVLGQVLAAP